MCLGEAIASERAIERNLDLLADEDELERIPEFIFGVRKPPQLFPNHEDDKEVDLLELCLKRDVVWSLLDGLPGHGEETDLIGSGTTFDQAVTDLKTRKSLLEYMPVIPESPEYPLCLPWQVAGSDEGDWNRSCFRACRREDVCSPCAYFMQDTCSFSQIFTRCGEKKWSSFCRVKSQKIWRQSFQCTIFKYSREYDNRSIQ